MLTDRTKFAGAALAAALGTVLGVAPAAGAQSAAPGPYERARQLVEDGRGAAGRALADSLVAAAPAGSPALAEALWWRAALAADARDSARDLTRLVAEVPASPRAGAATVRLAQLALLRDRPDAAAALLAPVARPASPDRPADPARAQAAYWLARARLEQRDVAGACAALDAVAPAGDADLAAQAAALRARVPGCVERPAVVAVAPGSAPASAAAPSAPVTTTVPPPTASALTPAPATPVPPGPVPGPPVAPPTPPPAATSAARPAATASAAPRPVPTGADRSAVRPAVRPTLPSPAHAGPEPAPPAAPAFAVQIAAYDRAEGAAALAARLRAAGLEAASEGQGPAGDQAPFRVKVGRYPTRAAAAAAIPALRRRGLSGFVTAAPRAAAAPPAGAP